MESLEEGPRERSAKSEPEQNLVHVGCYFNPVTEKVVVIEVRSFQRGVLELNAP